VGWRWRGVIIAGVGIQARCSDRIRRRQEKIFIYSGRFLRSMDRAGAYDHRLEDSAIRPKSFVVPTDAEILVKKYNPKGELSDLNGRRPGFK